MFPGLAPRRFDAGNNGEPHEPHHVHAFARRTAPELLSHHFVVSAALSSFGHPDRTIAAILTRAGSSALVLQGFRVAAHFGGPEATNMAAESAVYAFTHRAVIEKVPKASGVYYIFTPKRWVYVGESDDIQESLFTHLNEPSVCLQRFGPLSFSFELTAPAERGATVGALIAARNPACTLETRGTR